MAKVHVCNVKVLENPAAFLTPFQFEVTFDCIENLAEDLEWKLIYVGSAESEEYDQVLDSVFVGPIPEGRHMFVFQADPPDPNMLPPDDVLGVTVILLICQYKNQEFVRVGYYVNNEYGEPELRENPPEQIKFDKLTRNILASNPRVTRFKIDWGNTAETSETSQTETNAKEESDDLPSQSNGIGSNGSIRFDDDLSMTSGNGDSLFGPPKIPGPPREESMDTDLI
ncbi:unnamed protein product [Cyprideis torosa]|uniref:Uncharacterized protein n=1 Tax=Cyprideis torosa TaxID=163714 RepID=A0A7R8W9F3_9CRUS|nr:unnamed protein product [Cyprideis torosa]CAG0884818.1 unnamed protein product [Cyprideis torosa]